MRDGERNLVLRLEEEEFFVFYIMGYNLFSELWVHSSCQLQGGTCTL